MSTMLSSSFLLRYLRFAVLGGCGWLWTAALACSEPAPDDEDPLSSLSTGQLQSLCDELDAAWAAEGELVACENGWLQAPDRAGLAACGTKATPCSATVEQWRACMLALFDDTCSVPESEPAACLALRSSDGCSGVAWPILSQCAPLAEERLLPFDGVYEVTSRTRNTSGCDAEGPLATQPGGYIVLQPLRAPAGYTGPLQQAAAPALALQSCAGVEDCQRWMAEVQSRSEPYLWLNDGSSNGDLPRGFACGPGAPGVLRDSSSFELSEPDCLRTTQEVLLLLEPDGSVRLEQRTFELRVPAEGGECFAAVDRGAQGSCVSFDVVRARRVTPLADEL